jgi:cyclopropane-fatty-acyl-phospholipid synthase
VTQHVEDLANDYIETLDHWIARFDHHLDRAIELAGPERVRVFRLYLRAARNGFRVGFTGVYQVLARRPATGPGPSF